MRHIPGRQCDGRPTGRGLGPRPHRRSWRRRAGRPAVAVTGLCLCLSTLGPLAGACAGNGNGARSGGMERPAGHEPGSRAGVLDERRLRAALLDVTDFPTGWAADSEQTAKKRGRGVPAPQKDQACRRLFAGTGTTGPTGTGTDSGSTRKAEAVVRAQADAGFARSRLGPFLVTRAAAYDGGDDARSALEAFTRASESCSSFRVTEEDKAVTYTKATVELPSLGDGSAAVRFLEKKNRTVVDVVLARVGANTVLVAQAGSKDLDPGSVEPPVRRAVQKLRQVDTGRTPVPDSSDPEATKL